MISAKIEIPARQNGRTLRAETRKLEILDVLGLDHFTDDRLESFEAHAAVDEPELVRDVARGAHRSGRADCAAPAAAPERSRDRLQLESHREPRAIETLFGQLAVLEMLDAQADAADREALEIFRLIPFADDELRAAAADVDDEVRPLSRVRVVRNSEVDQPRFLDTRDDLDRMAERLLGGGKERVGVAGAPQRVRAHDTHLMGLHVAEPLAEAPQARERPLLARAVEIAVLVEPGGEPHHLSQPVDDGRLAVLRPRDDHVKAVRAQIDGRHDLGGLERCGRWL